MLKAIKIAVYLFDTCDHCGRWKLSCRMKERKERDMMILCSGCYEKAEESEIKRLWMSLIGIFESGSPNFAQEHDQVYEKESHAKANI